MRITRPLALLLVITTPALAIDGPGVQKITDANWGGANDLYPYVARLEFDDNLSGTFGDTVDVQPGPGVTMVADEHCTCTLIAPDVVATAGHCFASATPNTLNVAPGGTVPAGRVRVNFGVGQGANQYILNVGGVVNQVVAGQANDFAFVTLANPAPTNPIAILGRPPKVNDVNFAAGYGVAPGNNANNAQRIQTRPVPGFRQHTEAAKNWSSITVDGVTPAFVQQVIASPEDWTEVGDSGGPGQIFQLDSFPLRAYNAKTGSSFKFRDNYAISVVSGGPTPTTADSSNAANVTYPAANQPDQWQRIDTQGAWLNNNPGAPTSMRPIDVNIYHNLPTAAADLTDPNAIVKVFWEITFPLGNPWLTNLALWEEDDASPDQPFGFKGNYSLGPTTPGDDLAGYGHSADKLGATQQIVYAFDSAHVMDLMPMIDDFDWQFRMNYGTDYTLDITKVGLNAIDALIQGYTIDFPNLGQRAGFALLSSIPEPGTLMLALTAACAMLTRRRREV